MSVALLHGDRAPITWRRGSVRDDQHVDREVLRGPAFGRRAAHDLSERRAELLLHEALEGLARLPDVVDVVALLALAGAVDNQPLRRLVFPHGRGVPKHLLGDVVVNLLRELRRCRQDSNRHLASSWFRGRRILRRYVQAGRERRSTLAQAAPLTTSVLATRSLMDPYGCNRWPSLPSVDGASRTRTDDLLGAISAKGFATSRHASPSASHRRLVAFSLRHRSPC